MFRNKQDVDKHVASLKSKLSSREFNVRAYSVARLYFVVGDYTSCQKYIEQYISLKGNDAASHKLLGQTLQKLGRKDKALEEFQTALNIDPSQTSLILDICELLADSEVNVDPGRAKYWCERAEMVFPKHPITFRLRENLVSQGVSEPKALIALLKTEVATYPKDTTLHIRLLKLYMQHNSYKEAFEHCFNVEFSKITIDNLSWYETLYIVLKNQPEADKGTWQYNLMLLTVHERLCFLSLIETPGSSKALGEGQLYLHQYDQAFNYVHKVSSQAGFAEFHAGLLHHHQGQLVLHAATYLLKKAKKDQLSWQDASYMAAPLMLISWHTKPSVNNNNWLAQAPEIQQASVRRWNLEGSYRCSQSGHYLLQSVQDKSEKFLTNISQYVSNINWKEKMYKKIFSEPEQIAKIKTSYFLSKDFDEPPMQLPKRSEVEDYDLVAQQFNPSSLHHIVWILMGYKNLSLFKCTIFEMLPATSKSGPGRLNKLDILAFLNCATLTAMQVVSQSTNEINKPKRLPAVITDMLCSLQQMKWWECAFRFSHNELGMDQTDIRTTLTHGIDVVRCVDNHGLGPELLCKLGLIFSEYAEISADVNERTSFEQRAALYYSCAIPLLEKFKKNIMIPNLPEHCLFNYANKDLGKNLSSLLEESKLFMGKYLFKSSEYDKAIDALINLKSPKASFYLCQIYKKMALEEYREILTPDVKTKYSLLLNKAKKFAYKSLTALKECFDDENDVYIETQSIIEDIESKLHKLELDDSNDGNNYSDGIVTPTGNITLQSNNYQNSTPKHESVNLTHYKSAIDSQFLDNARSEPKYFEKIDNQINVLQKRDDYINNFMEQTKHWIEENRNLGNLIITSINTNMQNTIDQFKLLSLSVDQVKNQIGECRSECKDVGDLKKEVEALRKEIDKLKKIPPEGSVDERDSHHNSTFTPGLPFSAHPIIPPFRLPNPVHVPQSHYQLHNHTPYNMYNPQFPQPPSNPVPESILDYHRQQHIQTLLAHEQMLLDVARQMNPGLVIPTIPPFSSAVAAPGISASTPKPQTNLFNKERKLPVNVVITSSDPLPTCTTTPAPVLSVTVPPEHIKQTVHNYQIPLPLNEVKITSASQLSSSTFPTWPQMNTGASTPSLSTGTPRVTSTIDNSNTKLLFVSPKKSEIFNVSDPLSTSEHATFNKSRTLSEKSNTSVENYDPYFKPIIPLPEEVPVVTGEEDEIPIFNAKAKLYRFVEKEWKERGLGEMKLLKHKTTGKVRVLMRREQVFNICANHLITPEVKIQPMNKENSAYIWVAHDFAEESVVLEKFCIRFKTPEIGKMFYETFEKSRKESEMLKDQCGSKGILATDIKSENVKELNETKIESQSKTIVGGFTFSSTPNFKVIKDSEKETIENSAEIISQKSSLFSNFSFKPNTSKTSTFKDIFAAESTDATVKDTSKEDSASKINTSDLVEEYEPNIDFKPVIPLPALVDKITGEEEEVVLFEHRAKLLRFDTTIKEWKERGIGNIKILLHKNNPEKVRLLMRREQVMKVCCNHSLTKDLSFHKMPNTDKAVSWCAKDFSEGKLTPETFCLRFKESQILNEFLEAVELAQTKITDKSLITKEVKPTVPEASVGFGEKFKPKEGSWYCQTCYTNNLENFSKCACCEQYKPAINTMDSNASTTKSVSEGFTWGDQFKPKSGSWECKECYVQNDRDSDVCTVCSYHRDSNDPPRIEELPAEQERISAQNWANKLTIQNQQWECQQCFVRNENNIDKCVACNSPKDPAKKSETKSLFGNISTGSKFNFGVPQNKVSEDTKTNIFDGTGTHKFTFGLPTMENNPSNSTKAFNFGVSGPSLPINFNLNKPQEKDFNLAPEKNVTSSDNNTKYEFGVKPKVVSEETNLSKSPKNDKETESEDDEYVSEDDDQQWFKPVVPLSDKVGFMTGEQDEKVLFMQKAKLYVFVSENSEWKERSLGKVKILVHKETGKHRVLMMGEQGHKICLNHALTSDIKYTVKDEKSWTFAIKDFSKGEIQFHQFFLRFSNKDVAIDFKKKIDEIQKYNESSFGKDDSDDVIFVTEVQANSEEKKRAKDLLLPENFFVSQDKKPCTGCRGCDFSDDSDDKNNIIKQSTTTQETNSSIGDKISTVSLNVIDQSSNVINKPPKESADSISTQHKQVICAPKSVVPNPESENSKPAFNINDKPHEKSTNLFESSNVKFGNVFGFSMKTSENEKSAGGFESASSLFSNAVSNLSKSGGIFGNGNLFGAASQQQSFSFRNLAEKSAENTNDKTIHKIDENQKKSEFGSNAPLFSSGKQPMLDFGNLAQKTATALSKNDDVLKVDDSLSFSALSGNTGFNIQKKEDFKWEGVGQKIFASNVSEHSADNETNEEYDPHYDPIVPLPDKIVVSTGEEEEEKLYSGRAKLYRLFTENGREWKERGVGELKILYHATKNTYRLLLRREQVYKAVLNTLIFPDMELLPMSLSPNAWTWACRNFAENPEGEQETLALRFKDEKLSNSFRDKVVECTRNLQAAAAQALRDKEEKESDANKFPLLRLPKTLQETARADYTLHAQATQMTTHDAHETSDTPEDTSDDKNDYVEYEDYDYEEECFVGMATVVVETGFGSKSTCTDGHVQVSYNHTENAPKIFITDLPTGEILADMIVDNNMSIEVDGRRCTFTGVDYVTSHGGAKAVTLIFPEAEGAIEFYDVCEKYKVMSCPDEEED